MTIAGTLKSPFNEIHFREVADRCMIMIELEFPSQISLEFRPLVKAKDIDGE